MGKHANLVEELIAQGEALAVEVDPVASPEADDAATLRHSLDPTTFGGWSLRCASVLGDVLPAESPRRFLLVKLASLEPGPEARAYLLEQLHDVLSALNAGSLR